MKIPCPALLLLLCSAAAFFHAGCCVDCANAEKTPEVPVPVNDSRKVEVLARHDTDAVFEGTREHVCLGRTMLCPDRCGDSGTLAVFKIKKYNAYEKSGKYGDPKTDEFAFMLKSTTGKSAVSAEIAERVRALKPGDNVRLVWEHLYITDPNGSKFPERRVYLLKKE